MTLTASICVGRGVGFIYGSVYFTFGEGGVYKNLSFIQQEVPKA